jgi:hypothetical protein
MQALLAEIRWPRKIEPAPAAAPVAACTGRLALSGDAKAVEGGELAGADALMNALIGAAVAGRPASKSDAPKRQTVWCRDEGGLDSAGVYRAGGETDGYLLALGDSGRAARVAPSRGQAILLAGDSKSKDDKPVFTIALLLPSRELTTAPFDRLPSPGQALRILKQDRFATSVPTWGKAKGHIEISSDALK